MKNYRQLMGALALALVLALLSSGAAYAEGETPPEIPTEESQVPTVESTETASPEEAAAETPAAEAEVAPEAPASEDALETDDVLLVDAEGEPMDLASQETADTIAVADPYFTVGTTVYRFLSGAGACAAYPDDICSDGLGVDVIQDALNYIRDNGTIPSDRKLYIESGTYGVANITVDGSQANMSTINGLIGVNTGTVPIINGDITILNLAGGFTLQGFTINGGVWVHDATGLLVLDDLTVKNSAGVGIRVSSFAGEVRMTDVISSENVGDGVNIDNTAGTGKVSVTNAKFNDNDNAAAGPTHGITVTSRGAITLNGVSTSRNEGSGIIALNYSGPLTIKNAVAMDNDYPSSSSYGMGILINTSGKGAVLLDNVLVSGSLHTTGIQIDTAGAVTAKNVISKNNLYSGLAIANTLSTAAIKVSNSDFDDNGYHGLSIQSLGNVTLESIRAHGNNQNGADINNCQYDGTKCLGAGSVTVTSPAASGAMGANQFSGNDWSGLQIRSGKAVTVNNVVANDNLRYGVWIDHIYSSSAATIKSTLPVTDYENFKNEFVHNGRYGLYMTGSGAFTLDRFYASSNIWSGIFLDNHSAAGTPGVTISNGSSEDNSQSGIVVESKGNITTTNISANRNQYGLSIGMSYGRVGNVTIKNTSGQTNIFEDNSNYGVYCMANGSVYAKGIQALDNHDGNLLLYNNGLTSSAGVTVVDSVLNDSDNGSGMEIVSKGKVSLQNVDVVNNHQNGAIIYNHDGIGTVDVSNSRFTNNDWYGLLIYSNRSITLTNIQTDDNAYNGTRVDNCRWDGSVCLGNGNVTVSASSKLRNTFNGNGWDGLFIRSGGNISVKNFSAENNLQDGVDINNDYAGYSGSLTVSGYSTNPNHIADNTTNGIGMRLYSNGAVVVGQSVIENNSSYGIYIDNTTNAAGKPVTLTDVVSNRNQYHSIYIISNGLVTLSGVEASHNSVFEGTIYNWAGTIHEHLSHEQGLRPDKWWFNGSGNVTITLDSVDFDAYLELRDKNGGLLAADDNSGVGTDASITYNLGGVADNFYILVKDAADADGGGYKLALSLYAGSTSYYYNGIYIYSDGSASGITVKANAKGIGVVTDDNSGSGLSINTEGAVSLNKVWADGNTGNNLDISNNYPAQKNININYTYLSNASYQSNAYGMYLSTRGHVTINNGFSNQNGAHGISISSGATTLVNTITINNFQINGNKGWAGLYAYAYGTVTLNSVQVNDNMNSSYGVYIDNRGWDGSTYKGSGDIVLGGKNNSFDNNGSEGFNATTNGKINLSNFSASGNGSHGMTIVSYKLDGATSTIKNTIAKQFNQVNENGGLGLSITYYGPVNLSRVSAIGNHGNNLRVLSNGGTLPNATVISNSILNDSQTGYGLYLDSKGPVTLTNLQGHENTLSGLYIFNTGSVNPQFVKATKLKANGNGSYGIVISSQGNIEINTIQACNNTQSGASFNNNLLTSSLTIKGSSGDNLFINNGQSGLDANIGGTIWVERVVAISNGLDGIALTHDPFKTGNVTLKRITALTNGTEGLDLAVHGVVYLESANVMGNGTSGNYAGLRVVTGVNPMTIKNSVLMGNTGSGIDSWLGGQMLTFINTYFYGNDSNTSGDPDWQQSS